MSSAQWKKSDLYVYELSSQVLESLKLISFDTNLNEVDQPNSDDKLDSIANVESIKDKKISNSMVCNTCGVEFQDQTLKRNHYRTDYHTFNIKRNLLGFPTVSEIEFNSLISVEEAPSSLTESDEEDTVEEVKNESSDEDVKEDIYEETPDTLAIIIENEIDTLTLDNEDKDSTISHLNTRSPQIYFHSVLLSSSDTFGVYKSLFEEKNIANPYETIKMWNGDGDRSSAISALFMIGGGHFAGAIISHQRLNVKGNAKKQDQNLQEQAVLMIEHKTFHRYTTRRKQGGSQSAMDNAKGKANSAGSTLRRYNEAQLKVDVQNLLEEWKPYLAKCENIFLRARSVQDRKIFTDGSVIGKYDTRLRNFPFTTTRPNISELKKSWCELTYLKVSKLPEPIEIKKVAVDNSKLNRSNKSSTEIKLSSEEAQTEEAISLLKKGRAPLLIAFLRKKQLDVNFLLLPESKYVNTPSLLHFASQQGLKQMIIILLSNMKCNPSIKNKFDKTAWDVAKKTSIKQAFQIARYNLGEEFTDWKTSHIADPLSREQVDIMNKEKEDLHNAEVRSAIDEQLASVKDRQLKEKDGKRGPGVILDPSNISFQQNLNSLTDEQRMKLMREQRARAAEARIRALSKK